MGESDRRVVDHASTQHYLVSRPEASDLGMTDDMIRQRIGSGAWTRLHAGVYQVDRREPSWKAALMAAVLACGLEAVVSHRAALVLWRLDGLSTAPIEVTMPFGNLAVPAGVIVHRTRRPVEKSVVQGIAVTSVERTLLDCAAVLPKVVLAKALDSAIRAGSTNLDRVYDMLVSQGGRGVRGTRALRSVLRERLHDQATGSGAEFELLYHIQLGFLPRPELQYPIAVESGRRVPDFYWPELRKAVEVDGVDAHSSADRLDDDLMRQNELMDLGIEVRRFSARQIRRNPAEVVRQIRKFLEG